MRAVLTMFLVILFLTGCASPEAWRRRGTTEQVAAIDAAACRTSAQRDGYGSGLYGGIAGYDYVHRCMASLGYHAVVW